MTKRRVISEDFFQSEGVIDWTIRQRLLVLGIIANADDQGRIRGHPKWLKSRIFPYDDFTPKDIEDDLQAIASGNDTILLYKAKGKRCIQLTNWWEYQSLQWAKPSDLPSPDDWTDHIRMMMFKPKRWVMTLNWIGSDDCTRYKVMPLGNKTGNGAGVALAPINTITTPITDSIISDKEGVETAQAYSTMQDHTSQDVAQLYRDVTGQMQPLSANIDKAFSDLELVLDHYDTVEDAVDPGKHIYSMWCKKRGKTGKTYSPLNIAWIEKWLENLARDNEKAKVTKQRERKHKTAVDAGVNKVAKNLRI